MGYYRKAPTLEVREGLIFTGNGALQECNLLENWFITSDMLKCLEGKVIV